MVRNGPVCVPFAPTPRSRILAAADFPEETMVERHRYPLRLAVVYPGPLAFEPDHG